MTNAFDYIVIGRGLMGSAAARYLAETGARVALVGPEEPADPKRYDGPFASHHDAGRVTRHLAHDRDWSRLSGRSIARYRDLEIQGGLSFFTATGAMMAAPCGASANCTEPAFLSVARDLGLAHIRLDATGLASRFSVFRFPSDTVAAWEKEGGHINPRMMRDVQIRLACRAGAVPFAEAAVSLEKGRVVLASGADLHADHIVLATGAGAVTDRLLDHRPAMRVYARTTAFVEVDAVEAARLADMPSLIFSPEGLDHELYLLPPIRYPDGRLYIKIGGEDESPLLTNTEEMRDWFHSEGNQSVADMFLYHLRMLMPDLSIIGTSRGSCAVCFTETGYPYIARLSDHLTLLTGGNGAGAKCADELGRLGAMVARGASLQGEGYEADFRAVLA